MDYIVINDDLRTMQIPASITLLGVESDDDVNRLYFQMPKEYSGFDLSQFSARINYMNANNIGDMYIADDLAVDGDQMTFSWLVGRSACAYKGNVRFIVCLKLFDANSNVIQEFNTTVYSLPVLEGLETTEAVVQENADIIEYILQQIEQSGGIDMSNYYTKAEVDALKLPNPNAITINGVEYDGSSAVDLTIATGETERMETVSGALIHVVDAVPQAVESLTLYDSNSDEVAAANIAITNKNLFRLDLIADQTVSNGITFAKNSDGSITASGTSSAAYPAAKCNLDPRMFVVGNQYTISTGKTSGYLYVQLILNYGDGSTDYMVARNNSNTFTLSKPVTSCVASVQITDSGVTLNGETIYPQLEIGDSATAFTINTYTSMDYTGSSMPVLPAAISNIWANDASVASMTMEYEVDVITKKVDEYVQANIPKTGSSGTISATSDGNGTVTLNIG